MAKYSYCNYYFCLV